MDIYDIASTIGHDCQLLVSQYGTESLEDITPKIVSSLESLEEFRQQYASECQKIDQLRNTLENLQKEKQAQFDERIAYDGLIEQMEQSWYRESGTLIDKITTLEEENRFLEESLNNKSPLLNNSKYTEYKIGGAGAFMKAIAEGKNPGKKLVLPKHNKETQDSSKSSSFSSLLKETGRIADLQLIGRLKECTIENSCLIRSLRREKTKISAADDAAQHEVCRLAKIRGQLLASYCTKHLTIDIIQEERDKLANELKKVEEELKICQKSDIDADADQSETEDPLKESLKLQQLQKLFKSRNELKSKILELDEQLEAKRKIDRSLFDDSQLLFGPIPKEPDEKLDIPPKESSTRLFLAQLFARILSYGQTKE